MRKRRTPRFVLTRQLQRNLDTVYDLGVIRNKIDIKPYVDLSYFEEAKKRLGK